MKRNFEYFCKDCEKIENYQKAKADNFKGWDCHHRLETHNSDGERRLVDITVAELKALGMYYNRPPEELIFLRKGEHTALRKVSDSTKKKLSDTGKGRPKSEETKKKMSEAKKDRYTGENNSFYGKHHSEESKRRNAEAHKGMRWYNNGKINTMSKECPAGFIPGRLRK